ncbi:MAG: hypothetical protein ACP5JP_07985 [bacterium]
MNNMAINHYKRPVELPFSREEASRTTILYGGLTFNHEYLLKGAIESLGYKADYLPVPDNRALQIGKEYGNRGQCNPTYYTVGNLIRYLKELKERGIEDIEERFVFLTAGACGPCRFGMYESEYRNSLKNAGFGKFRVLTFEQTDNFNPTPIGGFEADRKFYIALIKALVLGDMLNEIGYRIRPYEIEKGETDDVIAVYRERLYRSLRDGLSVRTHLKDLHNRLERIKVNYLEIKPIVQIIGEFWAQTTEGDGNYKLARWLESEGAEVKMEPISTWIEYLLWSSTLEAKENLRLKPVQSIKKLTGIFMLKRLFRSYFNRYRRALNSWIYKLPSQNRLAEYASPYFNVHITGGEGHLEVAKHIMAFKEKKAHMVVSVKPFGCMPSTLSDGVQSKVVEDIPESIFVSIETSGDAEINVKSRVQMKLYEAKQKAREEFNSVLSRYGVTPDDLKELIKKDNKLSNPMIKLPHVYTGTSANFVAYLTGQ